MFLADTTIYWATQGLRVNTVPRPPISRLRHVTAFYWVDSILVTFGLAAHRDSDWVLRTTIPTCTYHDLLARSKQLVVRSNILHHTTVASMPTCTVTLQDARPETYIFEVIWETPSTGACESRCHSRFSLQLAQNTTPVCHDLNYLLVATSKILLLNGT